MKLVSWNVNGLRACMNKGFSDFLENCGADVVWLALACIRSLVAIFRI